VSLFLRGNNGQFQPGFTFHLFDKVTAIGGDTARLSGYSAYPRCPTFANLFRTYFQGLKRPVHGAVMQLAGVAQAFAQAYNA
jgi:hypothetical protein